MEALKNRYPSRKLVITFFSPSGFEYKKNYELASLVTYLPLDLPGNASFFIQTIRPSSVFFVKYEFWPGYLNMLRKHSIPTYLIGAVLHKPFGGLFKSSEFFKNGIKAFTTIFVQNESSELFFKQSGFDNIVNAGDPRYDRVSDIAVNPSDFPLVAKFKNATPVLLLGSSWEKEEQIVADFLQSNMSLNLKVIIAPHDISEQHVLKICTLFQKYNVQRYSVANEESVVSSRVLIVDNIGMLSSLYRYAEFAFVGGAFGKGLHNILEAVVFGMPIFFGPKTEKFPEAKAAIEKGFGFEVSNSGVFKQKFMEVYQNRIFHSLASNAAIGFAASQRGATDRIISKVALDISGS